MLDRERMGDVALWREHFALTSERWPEAPFSILRYQTVRRILDAMVTNLIQNVEEELVRRAVSSNADLRQATPNVAHYSDEMAKKIRELKDFLMEQLYMHVRVTRMGVKAKTVMTGIFEAYFEEPRQMPPHIVAQIGEERGKPRVIADYIAGMTDRFALVEYRKLFDPLEKV
jgi:dGTPase